MRFTAQSTSTRTFVLIPIVVAAEQAVTRRRLRPAWSPLLFVGYLCYRLAGSYRLPRAGGPPGMSQGMPDRLLTTGPYAVTRNPMYLGHLTFLAGLAMTTRSPLAAVAAVAHVPWFSARVERDEVRLRKRFGEDYDRYCARVPRWFRAPHASRTLSPHLPGRPNRDNGGSCGPGARRSSVVAGAGE